MAVTNAEKWLVGWPRHTHPSLTDLLLKKSMTFLAALASLPLAEEDVPDVVDFLELEDEFEFTLFSLDDCAVPGADTAAVPVDPDPAVNCWLFRVGTEADDDDADEFL